MTETTTQEAPITNDRRREFFDHLLNWLYHDCQFYATAGKCTAFYESLDEECGPISNEELQAMEHIADRVAEYIENIEYHKVFA